ncbi:jg4964 [Pararge aegeria aegeria]|uniref:Jg4964 protein n=1 Tax=Pararge aegeria aegeria TaxID=348720 RepID=A0A8S4SGG9_9NEOP|nr:jg4964 [Pararge aegeria aegeria]
MRTLSRTTATQPAVPTCRQASVKTSLTTNHHRRHSKNPGYAFQLEDLTPTGDKIPVSIARRSFSRGQKSVVRQLSTPDSSGAERIRVYVVLT